jgi:type III pantothenate kinase
VLLAVDVGNTHTVVGLVDLTLSSEEGDGAVVEYWRLATEASRTADEWGILLSGLIGSVLVDGHIEGSVISSTVPHVADAIRSACSRWLGTRSLVVNSELQLGIEIAYDPPREVGPDRLVNAVAAQQRYGLPVVVVDFGTATTVDAVSGKGQYLGGAIAPGIEVSLQALYGRAALLREVELKTPERAIGRSTAEAIRAGVLFGFAALADGLCRRFLAEMSGARLIATGGLAGVVLPYCEMPFVHDPLLTVHGLRLIYERNQATEIPHEADGV